MLDLRNVTLRNPKYCDRPYILRWDNPTDTQLTELAHQEAAHRINYRAHLLSRIPSDRAFLNLHHHIDREINTLKTLCTTTEHPLILLEQFDCFITYLNSEPSSPLSIFWEHLQHLRQLSRPLWIILPAALVPPQWPQWQQRSV